MRDFIFNKNEIAEIASVILLELESGNKQAPAASMPEDSAIASAPMNENGRIAETEAIFESDRQVMSERVFEGDRQLMSGRAFEDGGRQAVNGLPYEDCGRTWKPTFTSALSERRADIEASTIAEGRGFEIDRVPESVSDAFCRDSRCYDGAFERY